MTLAVDLAGASVERSGKRVVRDVDMAVPAGSWFGLIGANGSGKTSLLRALAGRLALAGGRCLIGGADLGMDRLARARQFGFAPPADRLPDALRVRDLLDRETLSRAAHDPRRFERQTIDLLRCGAAADGRRTGEQTCRRG